MLTIYHNPSCSKSRGALEILQNHGAEFETIEYLKTPLAQDTLQSILDMLPNEPVELVRNDKRFKELGLNRSDCQSGPAVVALLTAHPELMERPVVVKDGKAVIARPSEKVEELL